MRSLVCRLSGNNIGPSGATAIAEALKVNGAVTSLWLGDNEIGVQGATAIGALKLKNLFVGSPLRGHAALCAACKHRAVSLN
jgi:hypothetical protein